MSGQLDAIADKLYDEADDLHNLARRLIYATRNGAAQPIIPDWYRVIGASVSVLNNLQDIVEHIPNPEVEWPPDNYYDDRGDDVNPVVASTEATQALRRARAYLARVNEELNTAWSAIGHIGLRTPTGDVDQ